MDFLFLGNASPFRASVPGDLSPAADSSLLVLLDSDQRSPIPITFGPNGPEVIAFMGERRSVSQENTDRFPGRIVIAFRGERVIGYAENSQPNPMTGSTSNQTITVMGNGFLNGLTLTVGYPGFSTTLSGSQIVSVSNGQIEALIDVGTTARQWSVLVHNPGGLSSNTVYWNVVAPKSK